MQKVTISIPPDADREVRVLIQGRVMIDREKKKWSAWENMRGIQDRIMLAGESRMFYVYPGQRLVIEESPP